MIRNIRNAILVASITFASVGYAGNVALEDPNYNLVFDALKVGNMERLKRVVSSDRGSLNNVDSKGNYPIYYAIDKQGRFLDFFIENIEDVSISVSNKDGLNPLNYAIKNNKYNAVIKLLNRGVNPTIKDANSKTAFHYAVEGDANIVRIFKEYANNNPEIANRFIVNGSIVDKEVDNGNSIVKDELVKEVVVNDPVSIEELKGVMNERLYDRFKSDFRKEIVSEVSNSVREATIKELKESISKEEKAVFEKQRGNYEALIKNKDIEIAAMYNVFSEITSVEVEVLKGIIKKQLEWFVYDG